MNNHFLDPNVLQVKKLSGTRKRKKSLKENSNSKKKPNPPEISKKILEYPSIKIEEEQDLDLKIENETILFSEPIFDEVAAIVGEDVLHEIEDLASLQIENFDELDSESTDSASEINGLCNASDSDLETFCHYPSYQLPALFDREISSPANKFVRY